ncbi:MAG: KH domain-containing protein [Patescibacteria group bacterium]|nr:KH domain-containing protein [Patescibacteria group bacterium]
MDKKEEKIIKETIEEFLKLLTIEASFDFSQKEEGVEIILDTQDTALVIGYHGENLEALQLLLSLIISKKLKRFIRVSVEVEDYKKKQDRVS